MKWAGFTFSAVGLACVGYGLSQSEVTTALDCAGLDLRMCVPLWRVWAGCGLVLALAGMFISVAYDAG